MKRVRVGVGVTKNIGNYESLRLEECVEIEIEDHEKSGTSLDAIREYLTMKVKKDIETLHKDIKGGGEII